MQDSTSLLTSIQQRSMLSGVLLARFWFIVLGAAIIVILPWPHPTWIKILAIALWLVQGAVAARALRHAQSDESVRRVSRALLVVDTAVCALVAYLYMPLYHDAWAFLIVLIVFGSTQDRRAAAIGTGIATAAVILADYYIPASKPVFPFRPSELTIDLAVVVMMSAGISIVYRAVASRSIALAQQGVQMQQLEQAQSALRTASEAQTQRIKRVIELAVTLMRERELGPLLDRILEATMQEFGFRCGAIMTAERDREVYAYRSVQGYPAEQTRRLMVRQVPFAQIALKLDPHFLVRPSAYYAPVERQSWHTDPLTCYRPEAALLPRERRGTWHEADTLAFTLTSSTGEIIGILCPDSPVDGLVPSDDVIDNIALFARLAAAAIENVYHGSMEPHRELAEQVAHTLDLTAAIFTERDLNALLHRILSSACESFGFNAGTILLREAGRDAYVRRAAVGYTGDVEGAEVSGASVREMMSERARVRDTFYYTPMEMNVSGGITRDPNRAILPRVESGQWHENDLLLFPIFD
ncbi:MAG TPA: hypothetical protein VEJ20_06895, partial [Candidatus Eremiobacteraceae bacterium]|nr:hypothetical protein [Candidatus Eremiobacteraceae bacterium]